MPVAFGWIGAAGASGIDGSTHRWPGNPHSDGIASLRDEAVLARRTQWNQGDAFGRKLAKTDVVATDTERDQIRVGGYSIQLWRVYAARHGLRARRDFVPAPLQLTVYEFRVSRCADTMLG